MESWVQSRPRHMLSTSECWLLFHRVEGLVFFFFSSFLSYVSLISLRGRQDGYYYYFTLQMRKLKLKEVVILLRSLGSDMMLLRLHRTQKPHFFNPHFQAVREVSKEKSFDSISIMNYLGLLVLWLQVRSCF